MTGHSALHMIKKGLLGKNIVVVIIKPLFSFLHNNKQKPPNPPLRIFLNEDSLAKSRLNIRLELDSRILLNSDGSSSGKLGSGLLGRPDLVASSHLAVVVLDDGVADVALEPEGALLHGGVELAVDEDAALNVSLGAEGEALVLRHDALVELVDEGELLLGGVLALVDLVAHAGGAHAGGDEALDHEEVLGDVDGGVGEEVGGGDEETLLDHLLGGGTVVHQVALVGVHDVGLNVGEVAEIRVGDAAVVALVVVVTEQLPVDSEVHLPGVVVLIGVPGVHLETLLGVGATVLLFPRGLGSLTTIKVDPDKVSAVDVDVNGENTVGVDIKVLDIFSDVERSNVSIAVAAQNIVESADLITAPVAGVGKAGDMGGEEPLLGEDGTSLKLVQLWGNVP